MKIYAFSHRVNGVIAPFPITLVNTNKRLQSDNTCYRGYFARICIQVCLEILACPLVCLGHKKFENHCLKASSNHFKASSNHQTAKQCPNCAHNCKRNSITKVWFEAFSWSMNEFWIWSFYWVTEKG